MLLQVPLWGISGAPVSWTTNHGVCPRPSVGSIKIPSGSEIFFSSYLSSVLVLFPKYVFYHSSDSIDLVQSSSRGPGYSKSSIIMY